MNKHTTLLGFLIFGIILGGCDATGDNSINSTIKDDNETIKAVTKDTSADDTQIHEVKTEGESEEKENISAEEAAFNASGNAKAIVSESDMWPLFEDQTTGFSLHYPLNTVLVDNSSFVLNSELPQVRIAVNDIGTQTNPWDLDEAGALKNIEALAAGEFGSTGENALEASKKVAMVGNIFGQDFMVLTRIDMCNVTIERKRFFYFNNKQIEVTGYGSVPKTKELMPQFFTYDEPNCGDTLVWDQGKLDAFYEEMVNKKAPQEIQEWYDGFDLMMDSVEFLHK